MQIPFFKFGKSSPHRLIFRKSSAEIFSQTEDDHELIQPDEVKPDGEVEKLQARHNKEIFRVARVKPETREDSREVSKEDSEAVKKVKAEVTSIEENLPGARREAGPEDATQRLAKSEVEVKLKEKATALRKKEHESEMERMKNKFWLDRDVPVYYWSRRLFDLVADPLKAAIKYPFKLVFKDEKRQEIKEYQKMLLEYIYEETQGDFDEYEKSAKEQWTKLRGWESWKAYENGYSLDYIRELNNRSDTSYVYVLDRDHHEVANNFVQRERNDFEKTLKEVFQTQEAAKKTA